MEIEVKILDINVKSLKSKLNSLNALKVKNEMQYNYIYDFKDKKLINGGGYARIRLTKDLDTNKTKVYMTVKKLVSKDTYKKMEEHESLVESKEIGEGIFKALGLVNQDIIIKKRESYKIKNSLIEIDTNEKKFIPFPYIEIESPSEKELEEIVEILGFNMKDTTTKSIYEIKKEYTKKL